MKNNKGITLIALVVTIVVLLILAGVSIAMLSGENGILKNAKDAAWQTKLANVAEAISYNCSEELAAHYNKTYVDATATTGEASVEAAILKGITDSISSGKATSDSDVSVTNTAAIASDVLSGTVTLSYGGHSKVGTVTASGIQWADAQ